MVASTGCAQPVGHRPASACRCSLRAPQSNLGGLDRLSLRMLSASVIRGAGVRKELSMSSPHPLSGLTVVEIGHSVAAPYAGMILGELGAKVIKVENPKGGDACRGWGPPFTEGTATAFHAFNRAKRGITIDLGDPAQVEKLRGLIRERADVLIHNLKYR